MRKFSLLLFLIICSHYGFAWEKFYSIESECEIYFPSKPHHIKQIVAMKDVKAQMNYDAYLSFIDKDNSICMMIIANFPAKIEKETQKQCLEGFLNGIINHKNEKKLIYANFTKYHKLNALDFLFENQNRHFKGRAIILENKLYLIAMEYNSLLNLDKIFKRYIKSFSLKKVKD